MDDYGCPNCGAPYLRTASTDERLTGEVQLPEGEYAQVCYNSRVHPEKYFGFTLYFHPETLHVVELRPSPDDAWERVNESDVFASEATATDRREQLERLDPDADVRVRRVPLTDEQTVAERW